MKKKIKAYAVVWEDNGELEYEDTPKGHQEIYLSARAARLNSLGYVYKNSKQINLKIVPCVITYNFTKSK